MATVGVADIPTLTLLYKSKELNPASPGAIVPQTVSFAQTIPPPSKRLNDRVGVYHGDITPLSVDAIVNAANEQLAGGGGVDGVIHRAAGYRELQAECATLGGCRTGSAKITGAYRLPSKKIIHAVGPIYYMSGHQSSEALLTGCYETSLNLAVENGLRTIAFPCISTGVYGYPNEKAAAAAISMVRKFLESPKGDQIDLVVFVLFEKRDIIAYTNLLPLYFPPASEGSETTCPEASSADEKNNKPDKAEEKDASTNPEAKVNAPDGTPTTERSEAAQEEEAEKIAKILPDVPQTDPSVADDTAHVGKKQKKEE